jgi:hypothetical protein
MWVLRFGNGVTSAGVAVVDALAADLRLADGEPAWDRLLDRFPSLRAQFADATPTRRFDRIPRLSYRAASAAGPRWAMLPSAAAFADPLFSTGFPLTLLGIERLAGLLESRAFFDDPDALDAYGRTTLAEADHTARFVAGCYAGFPRFDDFVQYSMFYFAAASYAELARRVAPARAEVGFLRAEDPAFASALHVLSPAEHPLDPRFADRVRAAVDRHLLLDDGWAYATDAHGNHVRYHDANDLPTALAPLWGFCAPNDPAWQATMRFALSLANPGFFEGPFGGLGSLHTAAPWPLGDIQAWLFHGLVGEGPAATAALARLCAVSFDDGMLPEAYDPATGAPIARDWFAWPGAALGALLLDDRGELGRLPAG